MKKKKAREYKMKKCTVIHCHSLNLGPHPSTRVLPIPGLMEFSAFISYKPSLSSICLEVEKKILSKKQCILPYD